MTHPYRTPAKPKGVRWGATDQAKFYVRGARNRQRIATFLRLVVLPPLAVGVVPAALAVACFAPPRPPPSPALAEGAYLAEQLRCVDQSATLEESRACRDTVRARWAVDGGAR